MPSTLRWKQLYWSSASMATRCWMIAASVCALIRAVEPAPSEMFTASTLWSRRYKAPSTSRVGSQPLGGTISAKTGNSPAASFPASLERRSSGTGCMTSTGRLRMSAAARAGCGRSERTAALIALMCSGVVPQQPPTSRTPISMKRRAGLLEVDHRLDDDQVHAPLDQGRDLLPEDFARFLERRRPQRLERDPQRTHRARHVEVVARHLARQPRPGQIDLADVLPQLEFLQPGGGGAEGVGLDHFGPGLDVPKV